MNERNEREFYYPDPTVRIPWRMLVCVAMALVGVAWACGAYAQTTPQPWFTTSVSKGISPVSTTLTWTCPQGSVSATASSSNSQSVWNGSKPLSGSQAMSNIKADITYKLDCVTAAGDSVNATLTWKAPTLNTDNTPLTNLAGFRASWGTSAADVAANFDTHAVKIADPSATTYTFKNLPTGTLYYGVRAYTDTGVESALSNIASKTGAATPAQTFSADVSIKVDTQPAPPTITTIDVQAFEFKKDSSGATVAHLIGRVPLGTTCSATQQKVGSVTYSAIDVTNVDLFVKPVSMASGQVWAKCG